MGGGHQDGFRERRYSAQDGLSLYFRDYGAPGAGAVPVLCLTGLTRNSRDYHKLATRLAGSGRRVLCPDYRGRGKSEYDRDWRNYTPATYIGDIRHLLAATNVHRVIVVGTSLGAFLTMGMSAAMPASLAGAVLNDAGPDVNADGLSRILAYIGQDSPQPDWAAATARVRTMFPTLPYESDEEWLDFARSTYREGEDGVLHFDWDVDLAKPMASGAALPDLWPLFRGLRDVPVLALRGALSDVLSADTFERMGQALPHMKRVTVPGVGHAPTFTEPQSREAVDDFLAGF